MQTAREQVKNVAIAAKEKLDNYKAKAAEKSEKATATTHEDKNIGEEKRKAKESQAKANLHTDKAEHADEKKLHRVGLTRPEIGNRHQPVSSVITGTGNTTGTSTYPPMGRRQSRGYNMEDSM